MAISEIIALLTIILGVVSIAGLVWRFSAITTTLGNTLDSLGLAINGLKEEFKTVHVHGERLAEHGTRLDGHDHLIDKIEDRINRDRE